MKPCLVIERGDSRGVVRRLDRNSVVGGRDLSCGLWLPDASLRPRHAEFMLREGHWFVRALDEHAQLKINGMSAREAALAPGDRVDLGDDVTLRFELRSFSRGIPWLAVGIILVILAGGLLLRHRGGRAGAKGSSTPAPITANRTAPQAREPDARAVSEMEALSRRLEQSVPETPGMKAPESESSAAGPSGGVPESTGISKVHDELTTALAAVKSLIAEGNSGLAVTRAEALLHANPNALPAWAALAEAEEAAAHLPGAEAAWRQILLRSDSGSWYERAAQEMSRLTTLQMQAAPPEIPSPVTEFPEEPPIPPEVLQAPLVAKTQLESVPAPQLAEPAAKAVTPPAAARIVPPGAQVPAAPPAPPAPATGPAVTAPPKVQSQQRIYRPVVRIANVHMRRFPPSDRVGEQRVLEVQLERASDAKWIHPDHVRVAVEFFDQVPGGSPILTRAKTSPSPVTLASNAWNNLNASATFSYQSDAASSGAQYFGYRVQVFYDTMLQDSDSKPDALDL